MKKNNEDNFSQLQAYLGIQSQQDTNAPTFCVQFNISIKIFIIALALSQMENNDDNSDE